VKFFGIWLAIALASFGSASGAYHVYLNESPRKAVVVVDASFDMAAAKTHIDATLGGLSQSRYTQFALFTEKARVHTWSASLDGARIRAFGPRDFAKLAAGSLGDEFSEAQEFHIITNAPTAVLDTLPGSWTVHSK
jgi:hypothetical protein